MELISLRTLLISRDSMPLRRRDLGSMYPTPVTHSGALSCQSLGFRAILKCQIMQWGLGSRARVWDRGLLFTILDFWIYSLGFRPKP